MIDVYFSGYLDKAELFVDDRGWQRVRATLISGKTKIRIWFGISFAYLLSKTDIDLKYDNITVYGKGKIINVNKYRSQAVILTKHCDLFVRDRKIIYREEEVKNDTKKKNKDSEKEE